MENGVIQKVLPKKDYPVNGRFTCVKGINLDKQCSRYGKQKTPLLKGADGVRHALSWEAAFRTFAERTLPILHRYGPESAAFISTGQITLEEMALLGLIGRVHLGINGDGNTRLCMASAVMAYKQSFGFDAPPYTLKDLELSDTLIFIGANPVVAHPVAWSRVRQNQSAAIVVIDPRRSETAQKADIWLNIRPKSDLYFLYALANLLIQRGWIDEPFVQAHTEGFEAFRALVSAYPLSDVEANTGISPERLEELADLIHRGKRVSFWWCMGVNQSYQAVRTAQAIINLAVMTGNIGRPGTGPNSLTGQCNAMGSRLFSNTTALFGGRDFDKPAHREQVARILGVEESKIPTKPTIPYSEILSRIHSGSIKALWVVATNPRHSWTNNTDFEKAMNKLDFLVVQDLYDDTETSRHADLFLPSVPLTKKRGTIINTERRLSAVVPVLEKQPDERSDFDIFLGIGAALGLQNNLTQWQTPAGAFSMIQKLSEGMPCDITGVFFEDLAESSGIQWPFRKGENLPDSERRLFEDSLFFTENRKMRFIYDNVACNPSPTTTEYPYILNTGRSSVALWHTQSRTREITSKPLQELLKPYVVMHPNLAKRLHVQKDDPVVLSSANGHRQVFYVQISDTVNENHLFAPLHYVETNALTLSVWDPISKEPSYKYTPVKIKKLFHENN